MTGEVRSGTDFAVIVYRKKTTERRDALPAVTTGLDGLTQALRRQPSAGGTIGFASRATISRSLSGSWAATRTTRPDARPHNGQLLDHSARRDPAGENLSLQEVRHIQVIVLLEDEGVDLHRNRIAR